MFNGMVEDGGELVLHGPDVGLGVLLAVLILLLSLRSGQSSARVQNPRRRPGRGVGFREGYGPVSEL